MPRSLYKPTKAKATEQLLRRTPPEDLANEFNRRVALGEDPDEVASDLDAELLPFDEWLLTRRPRTWER